jgi:putative nucleotidyltransferase with HDIG domain
MPNEDDTAQIQNLRRANIELSLAYDATVEGFARALDLRETESPGHTRQVTEMTVSLARSLGIHDPDLLHIRRGALLHDIGKMGIPESILKKPGPLTAEEWVIMHMHPQYAYDLLSPIIYLYPALDIPYCHHERWDGTGYPRGLNRELIPYAARIFAVIDIWDALTSPRPYRDAWPAAKAREYIQSQAGLQLDPGVVKAFMNKEFTKKLTAEFAR